MRKVGIGILCLLFVVMFAGIASAQKTVLIVTGNTEQAINQIMEAKQFFEAFETVMKPENVKVEYFHVSLDNQPNDTAKLAQAGKAIPQILLKKPDVIVPWTDAPVKYIGSKIDSIPVVFGYVFGTPASMNLPKPNATGVLRRSFAPDIWGLAHKLFGAQTVAMLSKNNVSMAGIRKILLSKADGLEQLSGVRLQEMYLCDTFAQWQEQVENFKADFIYTADISLLAREDGSTMSQAETVQWTVAHSKVPVVAATGDGVEYGALYTILTSPKKWGEQTAALTLKVLNGTPIQKLPLETVKKGALIVNAKTAMKYKINIPYDILTAAEKIYE